MSKDIEYTKDDLLEVMGMFNDGSIIVDDIITSLNNVENIFSSDYSGESSNIAADYINKLISYFDLLKDCVDNMASYVDMAGDEMEKKDAEIAADYSSSNS